MMRNNGHSPSIYQQDLVSHASKEYKLFLVEVDDEDRERVLAGRVSRCEITVEPEYSDVHVDFVDYPLTRYMASEDVTITLKMVPSPDGTYFRIENFNEEDDEE